MSKVLFVPFTVRSQEITLLRSGLLDDLLEGGYRLVVIAANGKLKDLLEEYFAGRGVVVEEPNVFSHRRSIPRNILKVSLWNKRLTRSSPERIRAIMARYGLEPSRGLRSVRRRLRKAAVLFASFIPEPIRLRILARSPEARELRSLFERYKPSLILFSWGGIHKFEREFFCAAQEYGCKTASISACWDVLEDARWVPTLDKFLVWNEHIRRQLINEYKYPEERAKAVGMLRSDFYRRKGFMLSRKDLFARYRLDEGGKLVLIATSPSLPARVWAEAVRSVLSAELPGPIQVVVRLHPFSKYSPRDFGEFFEHPLVRFDGFSKGLVSEEEMAALTSLISHANLVVSFISTLILEACCCDTPNITLEFGSEWTRVYKSHFLEPFFDLNGVAIVRNDAEFRDAVRKYLSDPALDREERNEIVKEICFGADGKVKERVLQELEILLA